MQIHRTRSVHVVPVPALKIKKLRRSECWNSMFFQTGSGILLAVPPKSSFFSKIINNMHISSEIFEICARPLESDRSRAESKENGLCCVLYEVGRLCS